MKSPPGRFARWLMDPADRVPRAVRMVMLPYAIAWALLIALVVVSSAFDLVWKWPREELLVRSDEAISWPLVTLIVAGAVAPLVPWLTSVRVSTDGVSAEFGGKGAKEAATAAALVEVAREGLQRQAGRDLAEAATRAMQSLVEASKLADTTQGGTAP